MNDPIKDHNIVQECQRLQGMIAAGKGMDALSPTELAFFQTFCQASNAEVKLPDDVVIASTSGIDQSNGVDSNTLFDDPDAGRPDDPGDANPAAPDPAITRE